MGALVHQRRILIVVFIVLLGFSAVLISLTHPQPAAAVCTTNTPTFVPPNLKPTSSVPSSTPFKATAQLTSTPTIDPCNSVKVGYAKAPSLASSGVPIVAPLVRLPQPTPQPITFFQDFSSPISPTGLGATAIQGNIALPTLSSFFSPPLPPSAWNDVGSLGFQVIPLPATDTLKVQFTLSPGDQNVYTINSLSIGASYAYYYYIGLTTPMFGMSEEFQIYDSGGHLLYDYAQVHSGQYCNITIDSIGSLIGCQSFALPNGGITNAKSIIVTEKATLEAGDFILFEAIIQNMVIQAQLQPTPAPTATSKVKATKTPVLTATPTSTQDPAIYYLNCKGTSNVFESQDVNGTFKMPPGDDLRSEHNFRKVHTQVYGRVMPGTNVTIRVLNKFDTQKIIEDDHRWYYVQVDGDLYDPESGLTIPNVDQVGWMASARTSLGDGTEEEQYLIQTNTCSSATLPAAIATPTPATTNSPTDQHEKDCQDAGHNLYQNQLSQLPPQSKEQILSQEWHYWPTFSLPRWSVPGQTPQPFLRYSENNRQDDIVPCSYDDGKGNRLVRFASSDMNATESQYLRILNYADYYATVTSGGRNDWCVPGDDHVLTAINSHGNNYAFGFDVPPSIIVCDAPPVAFTDKLNPCVTLIDSVYRAMNYFTEANKPGYYEYYNLHSGIYMKVGDVQSAVDNLSNGSIVGNSYYTRLNQPIAFNPDILAPVDASAFFSGDSKLGLKGVSQADALKIKPGDFVITDDQGGSASEGDTYTHIALVVGWGRLGDFDPVNDPNGTAFSQHAFYSTYQEVLRSGSQDTDWVPYVVDRGINATADVSGVHGVTGKHGDPTNFIRGPRPYAVSAYQAVNPYQIWTVK